MTGDLSVIIPTFNTRELTCSCLEGLFRYASTESPEVIVVDNHSNDGTPDALRSRFPTVKLLVNAQNFGFARACNRGARQATGERYYLFLNSDAAVRAESLRLLLQWMESHPQTGICGPELRGPHDELVQMSWSLQPFLLNEWVRQSLSPSALRDSPLKQALVRCAQRQSRSVPCLDGACLMVRRQAFEDLGGFDEAYQLYFEDSDLCLRARRKGWQVDFVAPAKVTHWLGQASRQTPGTTSLIYQQSHILFYRKHAARWAVWVLKSYLMLKWWGTSIVSRLTHAPNEPDRDFQKMMWRVITERQPIALPDGP